MRTEVANDYLDFCAENAQCYRASLSQSRPRASVLYHAIAFELLRMRIPLQPRCYTTAAALEVDYHVRTGGGEMTNGNSKRLDSVIARDGSFCHYCGKLLNPSNRSAKPDACTVDHVEALANGGADRISNLVLACRKCNLRKRTKSYQEFAMGMQTDAALLFLMGGVQ